MGSDRQKDHVHCSWPMGPWAKSETSENWWKAFQKQEEPRRRAAKNTQKVPLQSPQPCAPAGNTRQPLGLCQYYQPVLWPAGKEMEGAWCPEINVQHLEFLSKRIFFHNIFTELDQTNCYTTGNGFHPCIEHNLNDHSIITFVFKDGLFSCRFMFRYA